MTDLSALTDRLASEAGALGLEVNVATHADLLDLVLAEYRRIRQERDNLAGTVELCTAPVDGGDLRDRVRAAGEAQRFAAVRPRQASVVLRVRLDVATPSHARGCEGCPLAVTVGSDLACYATPAPRGWRSFPEYHCAPAPSWCPLRTGPVTVEGES